MNRLYLIPTPLGDCAPGDVLPRSVTSIIPELRIFVVEELRTARRFLSSAGLKGRIDELELHTLNEHSAPQEISELMKLFGKGDVGLLSEAGLPAVADPGAALVAECHRQDIEVLPLVGPSSLMLALMGSGLDGQSFAFRGYLPAKTDERRAALRNVEKQSSALRQSQIFIETPYRNDALFADMLGVLSPATRICVAADLTLSGQFLKTRTVEQWKRLDLHIGKRPCVFIILA